jgi:tetratricopeptide (TPR) repeat protein
LGKQSDLYAVPEPDHLVVFSLGYRAAMADLLFGRTMVDAGVHFVERRVFEHLDAYLNAILALDPKFLDVYHYADTMLNLSTVEMPRENLRIAREIQERGLKEFPHDAELWLSVGMFVAYVAPQRLPESEDSAEWKAAGAEFIQHACQIWPQNEPAPRVCVTSLNLFEKAGQTEAAIASMQRLLALTDEPRVRADLMARLSYLLGDKEARRAQKNARRMRELNLRDMPELNRTQYQLLAPRTEVRVCAGIKAPWAHPECRSSFATLLVDIEDG